MVRHIMAPLSAYKSVVVSQCHLSFPSTPEDNNAWAERGGGGYDVAFMCFMGYLSLRASPFAFGGDEMCFNLVRGDLSIGGDNGNFICIASLRQTKFTDCQKRKREREKPDKGHGLKVRRVKKKTEGRNTDRRFFSVTTCYPRG